MMDPAEFRVDFGKSWRTYSRVLRETAPEVVEAFSETEFEGDLRKYYDLALPQRRESPINFLLRNEKLSYQTDDPRDSFEMKLDRLLARIGFYNARIPLLRKGLRLNNLSVELYLGQDTHGIFDSVMVKRKGIGNDRISLMTSNLGKPSGLDIDVGFTNPNTPRFGRNWFWQINAHREDLVVPSREAYDIIERLRLNGGSR